MITDILGKKSLDHEIRSAKTKSQNCNPTYFYLVYLFIIINISQISRFMRLSN